MAVRLPALICDKPEGATLNNVWIRERHIAFWNYRAFRKSESPFDDYTFEPRIRMADVCTR